MCLKKDKDTSVRTNVAQGGVEASTGDIDIWAQGLRAYAVA